MPAQIALVIDGDTIATLEASDFLEIAAKLASSINNNVIEKNAQNSAENVILKKDLEENGFSFGTMIRANSLASEVAALKETSNRLNMFIHELEDMLARRV